MKQYALLAVYLVFLPSALGQGKKLTTSEPFGLKGDVLGETLQEFREHNERTIQTPTKAKISKSAHVPKCTNDRDGGSVLSWADIDGLSQSEGETRAGVVKCRATLNRSENAELFLNNGIDVLEAFKFFDEPTIAGAGAYQTIYYFFGGKLYKIQSELPSEQYENVRGAFTEKYGHPSTAVHHYQNGFGASVDGEELTWANPTSQITIGQFDGTNVLDGSGSQIRVVFQHKALGAESTKAGSLKNRASDL
jgi:hypothetical protein